MPRATFSFPTTIEFGPGVRSGLGDRLANADVHRPLVVTDRGLAALPLHGEVLDLLSRSGLEPASFSEVEGDPIHAHVVAGAQAFHDHDADAVLGLGGGASVDVAKAVCVLATHGGDLFDYEVGRDGPPIEDRLPFFVAVPTTAGTGSEVGRSAVIAEDESHRKRIVFSPYLLPRVVFADPELTVGLPPPLTAATGMDALTHNVEAYLAREYNPMCDGIALEGVRLVARALPRAVADGHDLDARGDMLMAAMMGAVAFQKGLGLVHSCAHALGTAVGVHHGLANGLMLDHALAFNVAVAGDRFSDLAMAAGLEDRSADAFLGWIGRLKEEIGIPPGPAAVGVGSDAVERLTAIATADACHPDGPRPVTEADFRAIFESVLA